MNLPFGMSQWKPRHLLAAWSTYWVGLVLVTLGPALISIMRVTIPKDAKGSVSASFNDSLFSLVVKAGETTTWSGSAQATSLALWIAGPPLLLWLAWLATRPARRADATLDSAPERLLGDAPASLYDRERPREERVDRT